MEPPVLPIQGSGEYSSEIYNSPPLLSPAVKTVESNPAPLIFSKVEEMDEYMKEFKLGNHLPSCNVPEKIIIALDTARDENFTHFLGQKGEKITPFDALVSAIDLFVNLKSQQNEKHEFGINILTSNKVLPEFELSTNIKDLMLSLKKVLECKPDEKIDLTSLFANVVGNIQKLVFHKENPIPPPYIVRIILLYNRSNTIPEIESRDDIKQLLNCPYFFLDVVAAHEPISEENKCKEIFNKLQSFDTKGFSYFFNVGRNREALVRTMLKLLGHPLQRPVQYNANYSL